MRQTNESSTTIKARRTSVDAYLPWTRKGKRLTSLLPNCSGAILARTQH